jgi:2-dehydropantoate 2-reductase
MRVGVVGAGGVGGLVAGLLARAGNEVALVARGKALDAIRASGLRVASPLGDFTARVEADARPERLAPVEVLFVAVKTWQVPEVAASLAPLLGAKGVVVPLENGVDAPDQLVAALGEARVVGGLCHLLSWIAEPGAVKHVGAAPRVTLGTWRTPLPEETLRVKGVLEGAGLEARVAPDFPAALWEKLLFIASFGGVGALTRSTAGVIRSVPETRRLLVAALEEVQAVAVARGIALREGVVAKTLALIDGLPEDATASLQRDVVAGRPSEIDALSGAVARIGVGAGVAVPVHTTIHAALLPQELSARRNPLPRAAGEGGGGGLSAR